jgi:hypothetical protein
MHGQGVQCDVDWSIAFSSRLPGRAWLLACICNSAACTRDGGPCCVPPGLKNLLVRALAPQQAYLLRLGNSIGAAGRVQPIATLHYYTPCHSKT